MPSKEYKWHEKRDPKILASSKRTYLPFIFSSYHHRFSSLLNLLCNLLPWILTFILSNTHKQTVAIDTRSKVMSLSLKIKKCLLLQTAKQQNYNLNQRQEWSNLFSVVCCEVRQKNYKMIRSEMYQNQTNLITFQPTDQPATILSSCHHESLNRTK